MEFHEKLQQLRKRSNLTQEQLAEQLFVSRTAISKWESGRGYPNLDSLKSISKLFSVSIDELLSGDKLIELAETENRRNVYKISEFVFSALDTSTIVFLFVPLFGQRRGEEIRAVTLIAYTDISCLLRTFYFVSLIAVSAFGLLRFIVELMGSEKNFRCYKICSFSLYACTILLFALSRQPYITAVLFVIFFLKVVLVMRASHI